MHHSSVVSLLEFMSKRKQMEFAFRGSKSFFELHGIPLHYLPSTIGFRVDLDFLQAPK